MLIELKNILYSKIDKALVDDLFDTYIKIKTNVFQEKYIECLTFTGHFCEIIWKSMIYRGSGSTPTSLGRRNQTLSQIAGFSTLPDIERLIIPNLISPIYDIRNKKRGGHATDIIPTKNDALLVHRITTYVIAELVMSYSNDIKGIENSLNSLISRKSLQIEEIDGKFLSYDFPLTYLVLYILSNNTQFSLTRKSLSDKIPKNKGKNLTGIVSYLKKNDLIYENDEKLLTITRKGSNTIDDYLLKENTSKEE